MLGPRRARLEKICVGCAYVSRSALGCGVVTAVGWVFTPPFPMKTFDSLEAGLQWLKTYLPELDSERTYASYTTLKRRLVRAALEPSTKR